MPVDFSKECRELLREQDGVLSIAQAGEAGTSAESVRNQLRYGRWQRLQRGVYGTFTGSPTRLADLWAAVMRAGPDAVLSHQTAAELHGLLSGPGPVIHLTVPHGSNPARHGPIPGVVIHRSRSIARTRHPALIPPRTRVEDTVLDLIDGSQTFDEAYDWICRAIGRRRTTAERIRAAMDARPRFRWRRDIELALSDASGGALSLLELRYVRGVERPHRLPVARRQARIASHGGSRYLDNLYEDYLLCVELDGTAAHPADEQWRDKRRDRANLTDAQIATMRVGFLDLHDQHHRCATAAEVAKALSGRGPRVGHPCARPDCPVRLLGVVSGAIRRKRHPIFARAPAGGGGGAGEGRRGR